MHTNNIKVRPLLGKCVIDFLILLHDESEASVWLNWDMSTDELWRVGVPVKRPSEVTTRHTAAPGLSAASACLQFASRKRNTETAGCVFLCNCSSNELHPLVTNWFCCARVLSFGKLCK